MAAGFFLRCCTLRARGGIVRLLISDERREAEWYLGQLSEVLEDSEKLNEAYYFTCRNNFEMYVGAFPFSTI